MTFLAVLAKLAMAAMCLTYAAYYTLDIAERAHSDRHWSQWFFVGGSLFMALINIYLVFDQALPRPSA